MSLHETQFYVIHFVNDTLALLSIIQIYTGEALREAISRSVARYFR